MCPRRLISHYSLVGSTFKRAFTIWLPLQGRQFPGVHPGILPSRVMGLAVNGYLHRSEHIPISGNAFTGWVIAMISQLSCKLRMSWSFHRCGRVCQMSFWRQWLQAGRSWPRLWKEQRNWLLLVKLAGWFRPAILKASARHC